MYRRDLQRHLSTGCFVGPPTTDYDGRNSPNFIHFSNDISSQNNLSEYPGNKKKHPKNKTLLKLWSASEVATIANAEPLSTGQSKIPIDEFTLSTRTFEASFADGSKVFFRRDCFHRLLTVSSGSSVVIDDAPYLQQNGLSSIAPAPAVASSLSAAFTSCNGTGLAWLSPEARVIYAKALEVFSHCEKLEKTLIQLIAQNRYLKLPFMIGRGQLQKQGQQQNISQSIGTTVSSCQPRQSEVVHPFHAYTCPYCSCYSATKYHLYATNSKTGGYLDEQPLNTVEPGAVIEVGSSKDFSSSGIASKSVSPPNFAKDLHLRNIKVELPDKKQGSFVGSPKGNSDDNNEPRGKELSCCCHNKATSTTNTDNTEANSESVRRLPLNVVTTSNVTKTVRTKVNCSISRLKSMTSKGTGRNAPNHCRSAACTQCLGDAIGKIHISNKKRESSFAIKSAINYGKSAVNNKFTSKPTNNAEIDMPLCKVNSTAKRHHHHHGGVKRKTTQTSRHTEASWTASIHQSSIMMRSSKKNVADEKSDYIMCTPVSRCRDKNQRKRLPQVCLDENNIDAGEEHHKQEQTTDELEVVEIVFGESCDKK